jgi:hypothetical protein
MSCKWDYVSGVYAALAIVEGLDRLKELEEEQDRRL